MTQPENNINWIKNLVQQETTDKTSIQDIKPTAKHLNEHTLEFMKQLRTAFTESSSVFNHIKGFLGSLRVYGIADTQADFMIFRHGHKLIFSVSKPGLICIRMKFNNQLFNNQSPDDKGNADFIKGDWGAFNELQWTHNDKQINIDYLIRYYMSIFVKNSIK